MSEQDKKPADAKPAEAQKGKKEAPLVDPAYWAPRNDAFNRALERYNKELEAKEKKEIKVIIEGKEVAAVAWKTTPKDLLGEDAQIASNPVCCAAITEMTKDGAPVQWDLMRVLEPCCDGHTLRWVRFDDEDGKHVFWHSSAHILGGCLENRYHCLLNVGPATESDFFYDVKMPVADQVVAAGDFKGLIRQCEKAAREHKPFERVPLTVEEAKEIFSYNPYKLAIINRIPEGERITAYRCGNLVDLCRGPHLPNTGMAKVFDVNTASSVYLDGKADSDVLQRVHGLAFPSKAQLKEWETMLEEARRRDHRKLGQEQELFFFHPYSPGSCFFLPHGYRVYHKLCEFMREQYLRRGYDEVMAPNIFMSKLWEISGHWQHYQENMFTFKVAGDDDPNCTWALKPMNCPGHCLMFKHRSRSYRELPLRLAEFGVLHRNELTGALHGLTRVRRFIQDDSHIFCRPDQIEQEVAGVLDLIKFTYSIFGFDFRMELSTRPEHFMGDPALWDRAESSLKTVLDGLGLPWKINPGDGAFYGPKIDIHIRDALQRYYQCATIQLDFQLPIRFDLQYMTSAEGASDVKYERPVMIHRAVFGSIERFLAILIEHLGGKWPFWLSPRQCIVIPVGAQQLEYAKKVRDQIHSEHIFVDVDETDRTLQKKIREAQITQYNYILVVGKEEVESNTVNVRVRDSKDGLGKMDIPAVLEMFHKLEKEYK